MATTGMPERSMATGMPPVYHKAKGRVIACGPMRFRVVWAASLVAGSLASGCTAVYPELKTPTHPPVAGQPLDPPPADLKWIAFEGATVPPQTRDGRKWDSVGGEAPDPYAVLFIDGKEVIRTPVASNTLAPKWPDAPHGNYRFGDGDRIRVELWDSNPVNDHPIGVKELGSADEGGEIDVACDSGAHVRLALQPAHAIVGLGFNYELRTEGAVFVTRVLAESPAGRAGIKAGDQILALAGKPVATMSAPEVQSTLNQGHPGGIELKVQHDDKTVVDLTIKEGAIYPTFAEWGSVP
jgi:hypothetical protein